ncbi:MAG: hypothetical protein ACRD2F_00930 [Terriglobales bacterium]
MSVARAEDTLVRYESGAVFVNIYHGRASCEVGLEVGLRERKPSPHPISRRPTERLGYDQFHYDGSYPYGPGFFAHAASVLRSIVHMVTGPRDPSYPKQYP